MIHTLATYTFSGGAVANSRHSAYSLRFARIAYPWHPLFGRTVQISPFRRGKELKCIYTDERPDLCRELPNWMFEESYCAVMAMGPPEISIEGLNELAAVLTSFDANQRPSISMSWRRRSCWRRSLHRDWRRPDRSRGGSTDP